MFTSNEESDSVAEQEELGMTPSPAQPSNEVRGGRAVGRTSSTAGVWVQPHPKDDRWQVKREGASRASRVFDTQDEAESFGRQLAKRDKAELVMAGRDGTVRDKRSYGNDPANVPG
jgi:hypothetical protein